MKTILVATDYSSPASNAVDFAANISSETGASLILFNVHKLSVHARNSLASSDSIEHRIKQSEEQLVKHCQEVSDQYKINVEWELGKDDTVESLKEFTSKHSVDLLVMGIESNLTEYKLFGNTTTDTIKLMQFPLLVVPHDVHYNGINRITYACDPVYIKDNCDLSVLKQFIRNFKSSLEILHVNTNGIDLKGNTEMEMLVDDIFSGIAHTYRYVNHTRVIDGIKAGLEEYPSDLLVMIPHKLGFFESLIKGSHTSQMTVTTRLPLLVIPNEKAC